jgi:hypothetical protein
VSWFVINAELIPFLPEFVNAFRPLLLAPPLKRFPLTNVVKEGHAEAAGSHHQVNIDIQDLPRAGQRRPSEWPMRGVVPTDAGPLRNTDNWRLLQTTSTSLAIPTAISCALFAQLVLVEAGLSQFGAHIPPNWSLAGLTVSAAISFAPLPQHVLVFAGTPQLLALPTPSTVVHSDASRSNLNRLGKGRDRNYKKSSCHCGAERIVAHPFQHFLILQLRCTGEERGGFSAQTLIVFIPVSASVRVLNTLPSPTTTVAVVGFLSTMVHFFVEVSCTT